jgi:nucleotide-binding universal stress UspA family protein
MGVALEDTLVLDPQNTPFPIPVQRQVMGLVVEEILEEARCGDHDLVVIGAYRGVGWQRILLDDLAHRIIVELDRPVLVLR